MAAAAGGGASIAALHEKLKAEDYSAALSLTTAIVASNPEDIDVARCHVYCLMNDGKFDAAKTFIVSAKLQKTLWFEQAYCLYRANDLKEALQVLSANDQTHIGSQQLRAQSLFRLGEYLEAANVYQKLVGHADIDPVELRTNLCACYSAAGEEAAVRFLRDNAGNLEDSSDLMYNAACARIEGGHLEGALEMLDKAEASSRAALEEDGVDEADIADEACIFEVQRAYVLQCLGEKDKALGIYEHVLKKKPSDAAVIAVASNNIITLKRDRDLFDSAKKSKLAESAEVEKKLTFRQRKAFAFNRCLLQLAMNQTKKCEEMLTAFEREYGGGGGQLLCVIRAWLANKTTGAGRDMLQAYVKKHPDACQQVELTLAQLLLDVGDVPGVIAVLERLNAKKLRLGVTGSLVRLYEAGGDIDGALRTLDYAITHLDSTVMAAQRRVLMRECGKLNFAHGRFKQAVEVLEKVVGSDESVVPLLVRAAAIADPTKAERFVARLPPLPSQTFDVEALERGVTRVRAVSVAVQESEGGIGEKKKTKHAPSAAKKLKKKLKRVRKHIPDYDPNYVPDPDRWKPAHERAAARKGRGAKRAQLKGSQGSTGAAVAAPEITQAVAPLIPSVSVAAVPAAARKKGRR